MRLRRSRRKGTTAPPQKRFRERRQPGVGAYLYNHYYKSGGRALFSRGVRRFQVVEIFDRFAVPERLRFRREIADKSDMVKVWTYKIRAGEFYIVERDERFLLFFGDECLGSYAQPWQASDDLSLGAVPSIALPSGKIILDTSTLGIPADLGSWDYFEQ